MGKQRGHRRALNSIQPDGTIPEHVRPQFELIKTKPQSALAAKAAPKRVEPKPVARPLTQPVAPQTVAKEFRPLGLFGEPRRYVGTVMFNAGGYALLQGQDGKAFVSGRLLGDNDVWRGDTVECEVRQQMHNTTSWCATAVHRVHMRPRSQFALPLGKLFGKPQRFSAEVAAFGYGKWIFLHGGPSGKAYVSGDLLTQEKWKSIFHGVTLECLGLQQEGHRSLFVVQVLGLSQAQSQPQAAE
jgi:hypothetical protein